MTKKVSCWTHIILEAYCFRTLNDKKHKYNYEIVDTKNFKTKKIPNPDYDPKYMTPRKPSYCLEKPQYLCFEKNCPHLAYCDAEKEDYLFLNKKYKKKRKN